VNILVADDSVTMRRILELTFQGEDARVTTVNSGDAVVRKAAELTPDVVFVDLSLTGMDGYAAATAIKNTPGLEQTAVVVMASQKHPYDDERGKAAGVDDHILKPFDTQHVIDRVKQLLGKPRTAPAAGAGGAAASAAADAGRQSRVGGKTIAFGKPPMAAPLAPVPMKPPAQPSVAARPAPFVAPVVAAAASASTAQGSDMERKLSGMGLTPDQVHGVLLLSREVIEKIVWEVVPDLAETLIKEEIRRLTAG
jgi:CheY-like chemotaxis protein